MLLPLFQGKDRQEQEDWESNETRELPVLPLRNVVAFPHGLLPLAVGLPRSVHLLEEALDGDRMLVLTAMTDPSIEEPGPDGVYQVGTLAEVERALRVEGDEYQIVVRGLARVRIVRWSAEEPYLKARVEMFPEVARDETEIEALRRELLSLARRMVTFLPQVPDGVVGMLDRLTEPSMLLYMVASNIRMEVEQAQEILASGDVATQMRTLMALLRRELEVGD